MIDDDVGNAVGLRRVWLEERDGVAGVIELAAVGTVDRHAGEHAILAAERGEKRCVCGAEVDEHDGLTCADGDIHRQIEVHATAQVPGVRGIRRVKQRDGGR